MLLLSARVVIPDGLRHSVMALVHERHPGQEAFQDSLRQRVWWPGSPRMLVCMWNVASSVANVAQTVHTIFFPLRRVGEAGNQPGIY